MPAEFAPANSSVLASQHFGLALPIP